MATVALNYKPVLGFLVRFVVIYTLLIIPWPGLNTIYDSYFQGLGRLAFSREGEKRIVVFEPHSDPVHLLGTRMSLSNRDQINDPGGAHATNIDLDTRSIGWIPTVLIIALTLATPIPWLRRLWALFWGLVWVHIFILFSLLTWLWNQAPVVSLNTLSPFWQQITYGLQYTLIIQMGPSFSIPVLIWILVTFRCQDALNIMK